MICSFAKEFTSVLYSSGESWNYFLRMREKKTFLVALYNGVRLIFVWLLRPYQAI
jgi:hypothetical protein